MKRRDKNKPAGKIAGMICAFLIALLLLIYAGLGIFFNNHFFFGTRMESIECSLATAAGAQEKITKETANYTLEIIGRDDITEIITEKDIGLIPIFDSSLSDMLARQNGFLWPSFLFRNNDIEIPVEIEYSEDALKALFDRFRFFKASVVRKPRNAYIGDFDKEHKIYPIVQEDKGTVLDKELAYQKIKEAIVNLEHQISLDELGCYIPPEVTADSPELLKEQQILNNITGVVITYQFGEEQEVVDGGLIADWIIRDEEGNYALDPVPVREYIDGLARKHDTFGQTRKFRNSHGELLTISGGNYGWWMNRPGETQELMERIAVGASGPKEVNYYSMAAQYGQNDIGNSYVEIDLTNQHLYLYMDGAIVLESDFVSGSIVRGYGTPTGVFGLTYKERNVTLSGQNYATPVNYWMPFNGNVGMHDAKWRGSFGGDIFVHNGSHGCINLPFEKAKEIYEYVNKGFPVIVYGGYTGPVIAELEQQQEVMEETQQIAEEAQQIAEETQQIPEEEADQQY